ncbi:MAG: ribonuclease Z [Cyclobacteriaceae bacterium]
MFKVTILGSNGALPAYDRLPTAQYLQVQNQHFLIDCGEGTQLQLMKYQLPYQKINHIFISHLHGDHYLGLMGLLFSMQLLGRKNELHIYGIKGLDEIITLQLRHSKSAFGYPVHFHKMEYEAGVIFENDQLSVTSLPLLHKVPCCGFLFSEKPKPRHINKEKLSPGMRLQDIATLKMGRDVYDDHGKLLYRNEDYTLPPKKSLRYAYCSDTAYHEPLIELIKGVDLLYHEATFLEEHMDKAKETLHSTASQAATVASRAQVKQLLIGHYSARYRELDALWREANAVFPNTRLAKEGETIDLESP